MRSKSIFTLGVGFVYLFLILLALDLSAQKTPEVEYIERYEPYEQEISDMDYVVWVVVFNKEVHPKSMSLKAFDFNVVQGDVTGFLGDYEGDGQKWLIYAYDISGSGEIRLDFNGPVSDYDGNESQNRFSKGDTYLVNFEEARGPNVTSITRSNPTQQNVLAGNLTYNVRFDKPVDSRSLSEEDFTVSRLSGNVSGSVVSVDQRSETEFSVVVSSISGTGNLRLDFTGTVSDYEGNEGENRFTNGQIYTVNAPVVVNSINRSNPSNQITNSRTVVWQVNFSRSLISSTLTTNDFTLTTINGSTTGNIASVSGSGSSYLVTVNNINGDGTIRLNFSGNVTDNLNLPGSTPYNNGQNYTVDYSAPELLFVTIESNNQDPTIANTNNVGTLRFRANEIFNYISVIINGKNIDAQGEGTIQGTANYIYTQSDVEDITTFEVVISDLAGNITTFYETTDGTFIRYELLPPQVLILTESDHLIECEGTEDLFFNVVAVSDDSYYPVVYRWRKDGKIISDPQLENGILFLDPLKYEHSGTIQCEMWAVDTTRFDDNYGDSDGGPNILDLSAIRVSDIVFSTPKNLYVLQKPEFLSPIHNIGAQLGETVQVTFDAHYNGSHNIDNIQNHTAIQWYKDGVALSNNNKFAGVNSSIFSITNIDPSDLGAEYYVVLTDKCGSETSNTFTITEDVTLDFATQPMNTEGCEGDNVQLSVEVATNSSLATNYQWWLNGAMLDETPGVFAGVNTSTLTITLNDEMDGTEEFVCQVWLEGYQDDAIISDIAGVTVNLLARITSDLDDELTVDEEDEVVLMVDADGENLTYIWYFNGMPLDEESNTLTIESASVDDAGEYYVVITNDCGDVTSNTTILNVTPGTVIASVNTVDYEKFGLHQNTPNPFMSSTTISFRTETPANARLTLMDATGNQIAVLLNETVEGLRQFELNADSYGLTTGTYFYTLEFNGKIEIKRFVLIK